MRASVEHSSWLMRPHSSHLIQTSHIHCTIFNMKSVEAGQYFLTEDTEEFSQFAEPMTCREYTLPRDDKSADPKSWIRGNTVTDMIDKEYDDNEQETYETKTEAFALKTNVLAFASRSKAKEKPRKTYLCLLVNKNCTYLWKNLDWYWTKNSIESRRRDALGNHLKDRLFRLVHWLSSTLFLRKTSQESINLERKSYLDCSLGTLCTRGEFGKVT